MKEKRFFLATLAIVVIFAFILSACPPGDGEDEEVEEIITLRPTGTLNDAAWLKILHDIADQGKKVHLDLKKCEFDTVGNTGGGLREVTIYDTENTTDLPVADRPKYIAFDPLPNLREGKDKIISIILPDDAQMILQARPEIDIDKDKDVERELDDKNKSAFRHFVNLRSVKAANVTLIGNFAFYGLTKLEEVDFPSVGHWITTKELADSSNSMKDGFRKDIDHFAFKGCTALTEVSFFSAKVIGRHAFENCTNLKKINFPMTWLIGESAFEGCTSLTEVRFESATKVGDKSFKNCTKLKSAYFIAKPERFPAPSVPPANYPKPLYPYLNDTKADPPFSYDTVAFYPSVFSGCKALEILDVRNAWNVWFGENALEYIGSSIDIYLFDDDGANSFGHPQLQNFLGTGGTVSLKKINLIAPFVTPMSLRRIKDDHVFEPVNNIANHIFKEYNNNVEVNVTRKQR